MGDKVQYIIAFTVAGVWGVSHLWNLITAGRYVVPSTVQAAMMGVIAALVAEPHLRRMAKRGQDPLKRDDDDERV